MWMASHYHHLLTTQKLCKMLGIVLGLPLSGKRAGSLQHTAQLPLALLDSQSCLTAGALCLLLAAVGPARHRSVAG